MLMTVDAEWAVDMDLEEKKSYDLRNGSKLSKFNERASSDLKPI